MNLKDLVFVSLFLFVLSSPVFSIDATQYNFQVDNPLKIEATMVEDQAKEVYFLRHWQLRDQDFRIPIDVDNDSKRLVDFSFSGNQYFVKFARSGSLYAVDISVNDPIKSLAQVTFAPNTPSVDARSESPIYLEFDWDSSSDIDFYAKIAISKNEYVRNAAKRFNEYNGRVMAKIREAIESSSFVDIGISDAEFSQKAQSEFSLLRKAGFEVVISESLVSGGLIRTKTFRKNYSNDLTVKYSVDSPLEGNDSASLRIDVQDSLIDSYNIPRDNRSTIASNVVLYSRPGSTSNQFETILSSLNSQDQLMQAVKGIITSGGDYFWIYYPQGLIPSEITLEEVSQNLKVYNVKLDGSVVEEEITPLNKIVRVADFGRYSGNEMIFIHKDELNMSEGQMFHIIVKFEIHKGGKRYLNENRFKGTAGSDDFVDLPQ